MTNDEIRELRSAFILIDQLAAQHLAHTNVEHGQFQDYLDAREVLKAALPAAARP